MEDSLRLNQHMKRQVFSYMRQTRGDKYKGIIRGLEAFKYLMLLQTRGNVSEALRRGDLLVSYYVLMRYIDDIVDKDAPLPTSVNSREEYVQRRLDFASNQVSPIDKADYLMLYCYTLAERLGFSIVRETHSILESMLFDAKRVEAAERIEEGIIFPEQTLAYNFHLLDIEGTIRGMLKLFDDDPEKFPLLAPIGTADRIKLTLRDLVADIRVGLINIPQEHMLQYQISISDLNQVASLPSNPETIVDDPRQLPVGIREWIRHQAVTGLDLVIRNRGIIHAHPFRLLGKLVLELIYTKPSERYFQGVLKTYSI